MSELTKLEKQIAQLKKRADALRNAEKKRAIGPMKAEIARLGIEPAELFPTLKGIEIPTGKRAPAKPSVKAAAKAAGQPKYRDPKTGATWTGHGRAPKWFADAKKRLKGNVDSLLITNSAAGAAPPAKAAQTRVTKKETPAKTKAAEKGKATPAKRRAKKAEVDPAALKPAPKGKAKTAGAVAKPKRAAKPAALVAHEALVAERPVASLPSGPAAE